MIRLKDLLTPRRVRLCGAAGLDPSRLLHEVAVNPYRERPLMCQLEAIEWLGEAPLLAFVDTRRRFGQGRQGGTGPREVRKAA